jgi:hypothetical protein
MMMRILMRTMISAAMRILMRIVIIVTAREKKVGNDEDGHDYASCG